MLIPLNINVGLTSVRLGVMEFIKRNNISVSFFKPISESYIFFSENKENGMKRKFFNTSPMSLSEVESLLNNNKKDIVIEHILSTYNQLNHNAKILLVEGISINRRYKFIHTLNYEIAAILNAEIILLSSPENDISSPLKKKIQLLSMQCKDREKKNIIGMIINKYNAPIHNQINGQLFDLFHYQNAKNNAIKRNKKVCFSNLSIPILSYIPWNFELLIFRASDICNYLNADILHEGEMTVRKIKSISFCTRNTLHSLKLLIPDTLLIISSDHTDILIAACLATLSGIKIGAILLTDHYKTNHLLMKFCQSAFETGLPIFVTHANTVKILFLLKYFDFKIPKDDIFRMKYVKKYIADNIDIKLMQAVNTNIKKQKFFSSSMFKYQLSQLAKKENKCIVLPEGEEPRTIMAASICAERSIARCILLGDPELIKKIACVENILLNKKIDIINPKYIRKNYVERLLELRIKQGMTKALACKKLEDNVMLGTMMLENDEVDGLVSGAIHTTANTIKPSLQLIKTELNHSLVSSIFFMLLPDQILIYGDCAINPDPTAEQLAEIAIQSAQSAIIFGIEPRVAMISYATGNSSHGIHVDKVRNATLIVKKRCPNLIIDGPLQYDAAISDDVAKSKAPNSPVAGKATVIIFPDLNTGNTTYKAVQRSSNILSIGPMLQGMKKPVNDLSRGALIDDIVYTIALTVIQASKNKK